MSGAGPARLTSALLARKGHAVPASFSEPGPFAGTIPFARPAMAHFGATPATAIHHSAMRPLPAMAEKPTAANPDFRPADVFRPALPESRRPVSTERIRMTVRANPDLHVKVKLSARHLHRSMNDLITEAVSRYLDQLGPEVLASDWVRAELVDSQSAS